MKLKERFFLYLSFAYVGLILLLGAWWLYLILNFAESLDSIHLSDQSTQSISTMVFWEGSVFVVLLTLLSLSLLWLYLSIQKKNSALKSFLASMTHELKTPLASINLQAEVLQQLISKEEKKAQEVAKRLLEDTQKFETQMDKLLQLSRVEGGGNLSKRVVSIQRFLKNYIEKWNFTTKLNIESQEDYKVIIDDFALDLVLRNLIENTQKHSEKNEASIYWKPENSYLSIYYMDQSSFEGDKAKLGKLFYKFNSPKGSGIGLYLCKRLSRLMGGDFKIFHNPSLHFCIKLPLDRSKNKVHHPKDCYE